jgi:DNA-binding transcriptional ArsR family regulator
MANVIQGGSVFLERVFYARKENKTYPGLIALYESAPIPGLTPEEDRVFQEAYATWLDHAEALLAGDDGEEGGSGSEYAGYEAAARDLDDEDDQPSAGSIKDRILDLLVDGPMALRDVRKRMEDVAPGSVNNAMTALREAGHVEPAGSRGTYQLTQ